MYVCIVLYRYIAIYGAFEGGNPLAKISTKHAAILKAFSSSSAALTPAMLLLVASAALSAYTFYLIGTLVLLGAYENHWFPLRRSKIKALFPRRVC